MADLTISGASFGMSSKGTEKYIEAIQAQVLEKAGKELETKVKDFTNKVDTYWHGDAKDHFNKQIKNDADELRKKIEKLEKELEDAFQATQKALERFDNSLKTQGIKF